MPGSNVVIDLPTMILENDVRETTVAHDRFCFLQLHSPRADSPLAVFPKAIIEKFLRLSSATLRDENLFQGDDVFEIVLIQLAQHQALRLEDRHVQFPLYRT